MTNHGTLTAVVHDEQHAAHRPNHGLFTAYEFGEDIGGLDPSYYFGIRKDLYHFDHFMGQFQAKLPQLMDIARYDIVSVGPEQGGWCSIRSKSPVCAQGARQRCWWTSRRAWGRGAGIGL